MTATIDKPLPLSHRLRVCTAITGTSVGLSMTDLLALAQIVEIHERDDPMVRLAEIKQRHLKFQQRVERWMGIVCALLAANVAFEILHEPILLLAAWIMGLTQ